MTCQNKEELTMAARPLWRSFLCALGLLAAAWPGAALGVPVDCADMAIDPDTVPLAPYPVANLVGGEPLVFPAGADPVTDVKIAPPTMIDAAENFVCGVEYTADLTAGTATIICFRIGPYYVEITRTSGDVESVMALIETRLHGCAGCGDCAEPHPTGKPGCSDLECQTIVCKIEPFCCLIAWDPICAEIAQQFCSCGSDCESKAATEIECKTGDLVLVSDKLGFNHTWGPDAVEVSGIKDAHTAICDAYEANGNEPIHVTIDAHGSPGCFGLGQDDIDKNSIQDFVNHSQPGGEDSSIAGKISELNLFACSVAAGDAGQSFLDQLASKLGANVSGYTGANWDTKEPKWYTAGELRKKSPPVICPWDCEPLPDGFVNIPDFLALLAQWNQVGTSCDFDGGGVSITDFLKFLGNFGPCP
jgi:hypothetical protein